MPDTSRRVSGVVTVIMAAGKGTRMHSDRAKVLHRVCDRPMVQYVVETAKAIGSDRIVVVVGHQAERVKTALNGYPVEFVEQREQRGTGHAVMQTYPLLKDYTGVVLVLAGDTPLIQPRSLNRLIAHHRKKQAGVTILTARVDNPFGLGRIVRDASGRVARIVEEKDATPEERRITEVNTSIYCFQSRPLFEALDRVRPDNRQGEYYLTDTIAILRNQDYWIDGYPAEDSHETAGINTPEQLAEAERLLQKRLNAP